MKKMMLVMALGWALFAAPVTNSPAADARTLHGEFTWNQGATGDLEAVFTPTGDRTWNVAFHFRFQDEDHTYAGTAEGSLAEGSLKGEVRDDSGKRQFRFGGAFKDARFEGDHSEIRDGEAQQTGTLTLKG